MFDKIFNAFSKDDTPEPLRYPPVLDGSGDQRPMSRVFMDKKDKKKRFYLWAAEVIDSDSGKVVEWQLRLRTYRVKDGKTEPVDNQQDIYGAQVTPDAAIRVMVAFEKESLGGGHTLVPGLRGNYHEFANRYGLHIDDDGNVSEVAKNKPLTQGGMIERKGLIALYADNRKAPVFSSWEDIYANIVQKLPVENADMAAFANDPAYPGFVRQAEMLLKKMNGLTVYLNDGNRYSAIEKQSTLQNIAEYVIVDPTGFATPENALIAQHLCDASVLVGLMRTAEELYKGQFDAGATPDPAMLHIIARTADAAAKVAQQRFHIPEAEAKKMRDIIPQGPDKVATLLPLEDVLQRYPVQKKSAPKAPGA